MKSKKIACVLLVLALIILLMYFYIEKENKPYDIFTNLTGEIIVPMRMQGTLPTELYSIRDGEMDFSNFFNSDIYKDIYFPQKVNEGIICSGTNSRSEDCVVIIINDNEVKEIASSKEYFCYPILINNDCLIYTKFVNYCAFLMIRELSTDKEEKLYDEELDLGSKPIIINDNNVIFVAKEKDRYMIKKVNLNGNIELLIEGRFPVWNDKEELIYYYNKGVLNSYNMSSGYIEEIKKIMMDETAVLSPDRNYLAFYEVSFPKADYSVYSLCVLNLKDNKLMQIEQYKINQDGSTIRGLEWIN